MQVACSVVAVVCLVVCIYAAPVTQDAKAKEAPPASQQQRKSDEDAKSKATVSVSQFKQQKNVEQQLSSLSELKNVAKPVAKPQQMSADDTAILDEQNEQLLDEIASLRPRAVAAYLLTTGNWAVFEDVLADLVNSQLVTEEEAQVFYDDVNMEYEQAVLQVMEAEGDNEEDLQEAEVVPEQQAEAEYFSDAAEDGSDAANPLVTSPVDNSDSSPVDDEELNELIAHLMNEQEQEEMSDEDVEQQQQPEEELEALAAGEQTAESELEELSKVKVATPQQSKSLSQEKPVTSQGQKSASN